MTRLVRTMLFFVGATQFLPAVAFFSQLSIAQDLRPFAGTTHLLFIAVSSIFVAAE